MRFSLIAGLITSVCWVVPCTAQQNSIPGTDIELGLLNVGSPFAEQGHEGGALVGRSSFSMSTTSCNPGTVNVPWQAPMQSNHPLIAFMCLREEADQGRLVQISDRSWLKHSFLALSNNQCQQGCPVASNGTFLAIGCSDTYGVGNNGSRYYLGPPEEIDPWLGTWSPTGSFFDCPTGVGCDGNRTYQGNEPSPITHRVIIEDSDLNVPGASFYYYGYYVIRAEPENVRENNGNSRRFTPSWNGNGWNTDETGFNPHLQGTPLQRWTGATITSNVNNNAGADRDGRVYVATKVTGGPGAYHYEYALHNRDNNGGISEFRLPFGANASLTNIGFHDVDQNGANDWTVAIVGNELVLSTTSNPLAWNTVYNFWFDSTGGPVSRDLELTQFVVNPSAATSFMVPVEGPGIGTGDYPVLCQGDGGNQMGCSSCPCGNNAPPLTFGGCLNSAGTAAALAGTGIASVSSDTLRFEASGLPANAFSILNAGDGVAPGNAAHPCFGLNSGGLAAAFDGLRCAIMNTSRHGGRSADSAGDIGITNNGWGAPSGPPIGLIAQGGYAAGQTRYFQIINRDDPMAVCMRGLNTTQAVEVTFMP